MFKVVADQTFTHTVTVMTPIDNGHRTETFKATFRLIDTDEADTFDLNTRDGTTAFLKRTIVDLGDLVGDDKQPIAYSDELRDQLLKLPHVRIGLAQAYFSAVAKDPKSKN
ncbi:hypothetical protein X566_01535 [Afipia sp. P52-10]|uniref:hypothetical protein n=1 Tax=Afipia sp. P52-10 TaxID=1429916 RepID=UPI0003DF08E6|nr:hypothetical protein [Afipia sp. P52-10]ETR79293.1 hypothetical protein X566_01535 [Afipia sp. P52-10]